MVQGFTVRFRVQGGEGRGRTALRAAFSFCITAIVFRTTSASASSSRTLAADAPSSAVVACTALDGAGVAVLSLSISFFNAELCASSDTARASASPLSEKVEGAAELL
jgi:hypothetical protein